jgi:TPP-dependent pyruvate/acetoin dehydrogenase alpha subunit
MRHPDPAALRATAFEQMLLSRRFDERCCAAVDEGLLPGTVLHSSIGQEGAAVGVVLGGREPGDVLLSTHRSLAHCVAWGADLVKLLAEFFGRSGGFAGGLHGHMHVIDPESGILGTNGIVGAGLPMAVGAALGLRTQGLPGVAVAFFGDGAANTGAAHEALNLAAATQAPVVFVCEVNGFAETTSTRATTGGSVVERGAGYGIPAAVVDGCDPLAVAEAAAEAYARARAGHGPTLLECSVFRQGGHWVGDPELYRPDEDKARFAERDPLALLLARGPVAGEAEIRARVEARLDAVFAEALAQPRPATIDVPAVAP